MTTPEYNRRYNQTHKEELKAYQRKRRRAHKRKAIAFLGGKCSQCGYLKCIASLDFHHLDASTKDTTLLGSRSSKLLMRSWAQIVQELAKCTLLCKNCHAEKHYSGD